MAELMNVTQTLSSMEVSEMMNMAHKNILRKIEGRDENGKHIDGALDIISQAQLEPSDYFIKSFYVNSRGKQYPAYNCTRKGCEFLAHKFQGAKGIKFTIAYIERFHQMEEAIKQVSPIIGLPLQSNTPVPLNPRRGFYWEWKTEIDAVCKVLELSYKQLYHQMLSYMGKKYDLEAAREIYKNELGYYPKHAMDIVDYFPELERSAIEQLSWLESFVSPCEDED